MSLIMKRKDDGFMLLGIGGCSNKRERSLTTQFVIADNEYIPDGILIEILLRLPLKTIFKFKCVSKRWRSIISDPFFGTSFVDRMDKSLLPAWDLLYRYLHDRLDRIPVKDLCLRVTFKYHPEFNSPNFSLEFLTHRLQLDRPIRLLTTNNGLFLCCDGKVWHANYYICNPITRQWVSLPKPPVIHKWVNVGFSSQNGSYTVLRIIQSSGWNTVLNLEIFSSDTGQWRDQKVSCPRLVCSYMSHRPVIFYKGILHLVAFPHVIIAYNLDMSSAQCRLINLPKDGECVLPGSIGVCCGHLCYLQTDICSVEPFHYWCLRVWVLKDYDYGGWCLRCKTPYHDIVSLDDCLNRFLSRRTFHLRPLAFHPFDTDTVYVTCGLHIASFNLRSNRMKAITGKIFPEGNVSADVVFPFVLPPWPTRIPRPTWNGS